MLLVAVMTTNMPNPIGLPPGAPDREPIAAPAPKLKTVVVCGDDDAIDPNHVFAILDRLLADEGDFRIVHGGKRGADLLAAKWAVAHRVRSIVERASWLRYGKAAGPLRNEHMLNGYDPFLVLAFPGGEDDADLVARARRAGIRVVEVGGL